MSDWRPWEPCRENVIAAVVELAVQRQLGILPRLDEETPIAHGAGPSPGRKNHAYGYIKGGKK